MWHLVRRWGPRAVGLLVTAIGVYVVAPSVVALLDEWPSLRDVRPGWFVLVVLEVCAGRPCGCSSRTSLPRMRWQTIGSAQLAGLATGCVLPGGSATGTVVQASMLVRAGHQPGRSAAHSAPSVC